MLEFALLGDPVIHSRSPAIHNAALGHLGIEGEYRARRSDIADLIAACGEISAGRLAGANVTMPLKAVALRTADSAGPEAMRAGAANTLSRVAGGVHAANTDIDGIRATWVSRGLPDDVPVLVLGAGGAGAAAVLARNEVPIRVSARRPGAAAQLLDRLGVGGEVVPWGTGSSAVVINATPLGMRGESLPQAVLDKALGLCDLAYGVDPTPAVLEMSGRPTADGLDVLVAQAARSFEIWTGRPAPVGVMLAAARA